MVTLSVAAFCHEDKVMFQLKTFGAASSGLSLARFKNANQHAKISTKTHNFIIVMNCAL